MTQEIQHYFTIFADNFGAFDTQSYDWFLHPVVTPIAVKHIQSSQKLASDLATYNYLYHRITKVTLDYLTVNFSGRHTSRQFLLLLQDEMTGRTPLEYNNHVLRSILHQLKFDISDYLHYYPLAKISFSQEQRNFHSEHLHILPSTLIYYQDDIIQLEALAQAQIFEFLNEKTAEY